MLPESNRRWDDESLIDSFNYTKSAAHRARRKPNYAAPHRPERAGSQDLWHNIWHEGDVCCLFSDTNLGKSILAVQIGDEVARRFRRNVLYFDFEQSVRQFAMRYSTADERHRFSPFFKRCTPVYEDGVFDPTDAVLGIEEHVRATRSPFLIIDNISALCTASFSPWAFRSVLSALCRLRTRYGLSILVVAHTRRHSPKRQLAVTDLSFAGTFIRYCDAAFAIGSSISDVGVRYIKQIYDCSRSITYGSDSVIPCKIFRVSGGLRFVEAKCCAENSLIGHNCLSPHKFESILLLANQPGITHRLIAKVLHISPSTVTNVINKHNAMRFLVHVDEKLKQAAKSKLASKIASKNAAKIAPQIASENIAYMCAPSNREHLRNSSSVQPFTVFSSVQTPRAASSFLKPFCAVPDSRFIRHYPAPKNAPKIASENAAHMCAPSNREHLRNSSAVQPFAASSCVQTPRAESFIPPVAPDDFP
jgi:predicted transcriptional regulator